MPNSILVIDGAFKTMSDKIDFRSMTRNFLRGEADEDTSEAVEEATLLKEAADRRLLIVHEAARLKNTFISAELTLLVDEIKRL